VSVLWISDPFVTKSPYTCLDLTYFLFLWQIRLFYLQECTPRTWHPLEFFSLNDVRGDHDAYHDGFCCYLDVHHACDDDDAYGALVWERLGYMDGEMSCIHRLEHRLP